MESGTPISRDGGFEKRQIFSFTIEDAYIFPFNIQVLITCRFSGMISNTIMHTLPIVSPIINIVFSLISISLTSPFWKESIYKISLNLLPPNIYIHSKVLSARSLRTVHFPFNYHPVFQNQSFHSSIHPNKSKSHIFIYFLNFFY